MIKHFYDFIITYLILPYSLVLYVGFTSLMMREFIASWLKERREKKAAKNKTGGDAK